MSATQDKSQKVKFAESNVIQLRRKDQAEVKPNPYAKMYEKAASSSKAFPTAPVQAKSGILKADDLKKAGIRVDSFNPSEVSGSQRISRTSFLASPIKASDSAGSQSIVSPNETVENLKKNLKALNDLHSRLKFMLQELEDLVDES